MSVNHAMLHSLYLHAIIGGFKAQHELDTQFTILSAMMGMNNIMPYHAYAMEQRVRHTSNIAVAPIFAQRVVDALSYKPKKKKYNVPSAEDLSDLLMSLLWDGIYTEHHYFPEYARNPFGNGLPLYTYREFDKIKATGSTLSPMYGQSEISNWKSTWTFPLAKGLRTDRYRESLSLATDANYVSVSTDARYFETAEYKDFFDKMTYLMGELRDNGKPMFVWYPIVWPSLLSVPFVPLNAMAASKDTVPIQIVPNQHLMAMGIHRYSDTLSTLCEELSIALQEIADKALKQYESESVCKEEIHTQLKPLLGIGDDIPIDDPDRYKVVNSGIQLLTAVTMSYFVNQLP